MGRVGDVVMTHVFWPVVPRCVPRDLAPFVFTAFFFTAFFAAGFALADLPLVVAFLRTAHPLLIHSGER
jgi:hypothetical protein